MPQQHAANVASFVDFFQEFSLLRPIHHFSFSSWGVACVTLLVSTWLLASSVGQAQTANQNGSGKTNSDATEKVFLTIVEEITQMVPGGIETDSALDKKLREAADLFANRKLKEAQESLNALADSDDRIPPAELMLAAMAYTVGDNSSGQRLLESAAVKHADYPDIYFSFARLAVGQNRATDADALADKALATIQSNGGKFSDVQMDHFKQRYYDVKYQVAKLRGNTEDAKAAVASMDEVAPGAAQSLLANAEIAFDDGDADTALKYLKKLNEAENDADQQPAEVTLASWFQRAGKADEAGKLLKWAASQRRRDENVQFALANWSLNQEDFTSTISAVKAIEEISGDSNATRELRGKVSFAQGAYSLAENQFRKLSADNPVNFDYANLYALSLAHSTSKEKQDAAVDLAKQIAQAKSNNIVAVSSLAYVLMKSGQLDAARSIISKVAQQPNLNVEVTFIVCYFLSESGQKDQAKRILEKIVNAQGLFLFRSEAKKLLAIIGQSSEGLPAPK